MPSTVNVDKSWWLMDHIFQGIFTEISSPRTCYAVAQSKWKLQILVWQERSDQDHHSRIMSQQDGNFKFIVL